MHLKLHEQRKRQDTHDEVSDHTDRRLGYDIDWLVVALKLPGVR
jgi:hypothetical protein